MTPKKTFYGSTKLSMTPKKCLGVPKNSPRLQKEKSQVAKLASRQLRAEVNAEKAVIKAEKSAKKNLEKTAALNKAIETHNLDVTRGIKMGKFIDAYDPSHSTKKLATDFIKYVAQERARIEAKKKRPPKKQAEATPISSKQPFSKDSTKKRPNHRVEDIKNGSTVRLRTGKERGEVLLIKGKKATVLFGEFKTVVTLDKLSFIK